MGKLEETNHSRASVLSKRWCTEVTAASLLCFQVICDVLKIEQRCCAHKKKIQKQYLIVVTTRDAHSFNSDWTVLSRKYI